MDRDGNLIQFEIIRTLTSLAEYEDDWNQLAEQSPQKSPMNSWAWIATYLEYRLRDDQSWFCIAARSRDCLLGIFPVIYTKNITMRISHTTLNTPYDAHTMATDLIVDHKYAEILIPEMIRIAMDEYPKCWYLEFHQLVEQSPTLSWSRNSNIKSRIIEEFQGVGSYLNTEITFTDIKSLLSKNFKHNLNKARNRLQKLGDMQVEFITGSNASPDYLARMANVENNSWKAAAGTSILQSQELVDFYTRLCERLSKPGWLEWHFLNTDEKTISAHLSIMFSTTLAIWKIGYDDDYKKYSPGSILMEDVIKRACSCENTHEVNMMTDMPWHDNWKTSKREYFKVRIYSLQPNAIVFGLFPQKLKSWLRSFSPIYKLLSSIKNILR